MKYHVFDTLMDGVVVVDSDELIVYANTAAAEIVEYPERRIIGKLKFKECFKFSDNLWSGTIKSVKTSMPYLEVIVTSKSGKENVVQVSVQPEDDTDLGLGRWIFYLKNLTLEARLQEKYAKEVLGKNIAEEAARKDPLTGAYNRRGLREKYEVMCDRVDNDGSEFSLVIFDIDNFKKVNDKYGHIAGDLVLKHISEIIGKKLLRESDVLGRFGGEEFAVLLNRCTLENAETVAERIRLVVEKESIVFEGQKINVTISVGVGEYKKGRENLDEFFKKVDEASYESKRTGKNKVTAFKGNIT